MAKAAEALCVTSAALATRVKLLEEDLRLQRFEGRLRLTEAGKEAVSAAARIDNVMFETSSIRFVAKTACWQGAFALAWFRQQNSSRPDSSRPL